LQAKMLVAAFRLLRPGGVLVYSTCTVAPEENEAPVSTLLAREPDAAVEPLRLHDPAPPRGLVRWEGGRFAGGPGRGAAARARGRLRGVLRVPHPPARPRARPVRPGRGRPRRGGPVIRR